MKIENFLIQRNYTHKPAEKLKHRIFRVFHEILTNYNVNSKIYACFLILQMLQFITFTIHYSYEGLWPAQIAQRAIKIISIINMNQIWQYIGLIGYLIFLLISTLLLVAIFLFFLYEILKKRHYQPTNHNVIAFTIVAYFDTALRTILFLPMFLSFGYAFTIGIDNNAVKILLIILASCDNILLVGISTGLSWFLVDNSPFSALPFSMPLSKIQLFKLVLKLFLGIYENLNLSQNRLNTAFLGVIIVNLSFIVSQFYKGFRLNHEPFRTIYQLTVIIPLWFGISSLIQQLMTSQQNLGLLFMAIGSFIFIFAWFGIQKHKTNCIIKGNYKIFSCDYQTVRYNLQCIRCCINYHNSESIITLQGILSYHKLFCKKSKDNCPCSRLIQRINQISLLDRNNQDLSEELRCWYQFVKFNLLQAKSKFKDNPELSLLLSYVQVTKLSNKFRALYNLQDTSQFSNGYICQFLNYHCRRQIQQQIFVQDLQKNEKKTININKFFDFQIYFYELQRQIEQSANDHLAFWQILKSESISRDKILKQGQLITERITKIAKIYKKLIKMNPNNIQMLLLYGIFTKIILKYPDIYEKNAEHLEYLKETYKNNLIFDLCKQKYNENALTGIIIISGQRKDIGSIKHCNSKVTEILRYSPYQLISQNINVLMPKFIGNMHDDVLRNYLELENSQYDFVERLAPMIDKDNYMILVSILTKPLPSLLNGLLLIGIFNEITEKNENHNNQQSKYLLYRADTGYIEALSQSCFNQCGYRTAKLDQANENSIQLQISSTFATNIKNINDLKVDKSIKAELKMKDIDEEMAIHEVDLYLKYQIVYFGTKLRLLEFFMNTNYINNQNQSLVYMYNKNFTQSKAQELQGQNGQKLSKLGKSQITHLIQDKSAQNPKIYPIGLKILGKIGFLYLVIFLAIFSLIFAFDLSVGPQLQKSSLISTTVSKVLGKIIDIAFYSRLMQLSKIYQNNKEIQKILIFDEMKNNISVLNNYLQKQQFDLVNLYVQITQNGFDIQQQITQYKPIIINDSQIDFNSSNVSLNDGIFSYITSTSSFSSSPQSNISFALSLPETVQPYINYQAFNNFFHIHYTALYSLIQKKFQFTERINQYQAKQVSTKKLWVILFLVFFIIIMAIFTLILMVLASKVENITQKFIMLFGFFSISNINEEIYHCELFLEIFYEDSYFVRLKKRAQMRDTNINKQDSFEIDTVKLKRFSTSAIDASSQFSKVQVGGRISITNALSPGNKLELMEKKFQQLSSSKELINIEPANNNNTNNSNSNTIMSANSQNNKEEQEEIYQKLQQNVTKSKLLLWICGLTFFFILTLLQTTRVVYLASFIQERSIDSDLLQTLIKNLNLFRATNLYGLQATIDDKAGYFQEFSIKNMFMNYISNIQEQERHLSYIASNQKQQSHINDIHEDQRSSICSKIDNFKNLLKNFNSSSFAIEQCQLLADGLLKQGERATFIGMLELLQNISSNSSKQLQFQATIEQLLVDKQFVNLFRTKKYIEGIIELFISTLANSIMNNIQRYKKVIIVYLIINCVISCLFLLVGRSRAFRWLENRFAIAMQISTLIPTKVFDKNNKMMKQYEQIQDKLI